MRVTSATLFPLLCLIRCISKSVLSDLEEFRLYLVIMRPESDNELRVEVSDAADEGPSSLTEAIGMELSLEDPIGHALSTFAKSLDDLEKRIACTLGEFAKNLATLKDGQARIQRRLKKVSRKSVISGNSLPNAKGREKRVLFAPSGFRSFNLEKCNDFVKSYNEGNEKDQVELLTKNMAVAAQVSNAIS